MKLELSIRANQLKNVAGTFKGVSDPFAIVTRLSTSEGEKPVVLGKTEVVKNNLNPRWVKIFILDYELGTPQKLAINVFDEVKKGSNVGMGSAVFDVGELLGARGNTQIKKLKKGGNVFATVRKSEGVGTLQFHFKAEKLKNTEGLFSKSDPFYEISRKVSVVGGQFSWDIVHRSEYIKNNLDPVWKEDSIELSILCGGDRNLPLQITIYDYERSGKHVFMGTIETTVNALVQRGSEGMTLTKKGKVTGKLIITKAKVVGDDVPTTKAAAATATPPAPTQEMATVDLNNRKEAPVVAGVPVTSATAPPTDQSNERSAASNSNDKKQLFVDYVSGGCEFSVIVAIDFTGSNGDPRKPGTLHHIDKKSRNSYEQAMSAIVSILLQYDHDKKIPVFGFGAKFDGAVNHCFQCGPTPDADGLQGVMDAYKAVFSSGLILSKPTVFNEVLETAAERAESNKAAADKSGGQAYTILLIITDGAVSDVNSTAACLSRVSNCPLSVVIVGVGDADFAAMKFLDDSAIETGKRDIAQFVAFDQHAHSSQSLTKATLEEIPVQVVEYFQSQNIQPLPPVYRDGDFSFSNLDAGEAQEEVNLNLDIGDSGVVVSGGGFGYVDGFNAR